MKKVQLTPKEVETLIYAINSNLDELQYCEGTQREQNSLLKVLKKLDGKRENS